VSGQVDQVGNIRGRAPGLLRRNCLLLLAVGVVSTLWPTPSSGQSESSIAGIVARMGLGPTSLGGTAFGFGMEIEAVPKSTIVPSLRLDAWSFGIDCIGFEPCPSGVSTFAVGAKYRVRGGSPVMPYVAADVGYMSWASDAEGVSLEH